MDHKRSKRQTRSNTEESEINHLQLTGNQQPFLNPLIIQKILEYCKFNSKNGQSFHSLRLVCKLWDEECCKFLRQETQISIPKLLEPYPNGLGWTNYYYKCPFPETKEFENFQIHLTCELSKNRKLLRWFNNMGGQIKSLHFISSLTCFHENDFLANILFKWCPNLESLHLDGIQCFKSLIYFFEGKLKEFRTFKNSAIKSKNLRNLTISVEDNKGRNDCTCKIGELIPGTASMEMIYLKLFMSDLYELIKKLPEKDFSKNSQISHLLYQFVETGAPDNILDTIKKYLQVDNVDWGVLGAILRTAPIKKLIVNQLFDVSQTQDFVKFLLLNSNKPGSNFDHLEFRNASVSTGCLKTLSLLQYPLSKLCLENIMWRQDTGDFLKNIFIKCAGTLTSFEVGLENLSYEAPENETMNTLKIPMLPKLKYFTNKTIGLLHVNGLDLLSKAPILEKCYLDNLRFKGNSALDRFMTFAAFGSFCRQLDDPSVKEHILRELKMDFAVEGQHIQLLRKGLANLKKVELKTFSPVEIISGFALGEGWDNLEEFSISIGKRNKRDWKGLTKIKYEDISKCFENLKGVKFVEIAFQPEEIGFLPVPWFTHGFSKMRNLTSLKIFNLQIPVKRKAEVDRSIAHITFVSFKREIEISKEDLDSSLSAEETE